ESKPAYHAAERQPGCPKRRPEPALPEAQGHRRRRLLRSRATPGSKAPTLSAETASVALPPRLAGCRGRPADPEEPTGRQAPSAARPLPAPEERRAKRTSAG